MRHALFAPLVLTTIAVTGCGASEPQQLALGDCLTISGAGSEVETVPVVACDGVHEAEVYALFDVADAATYDEKALLAEVEDECVSRFDDYVGEPYRTSPLDVFYLYPLEHGWADGDREAVCAAFAPDPDTGQPIAFEGTLAGAGA